MEGAQPRARLEQMRAKDPVLATHFIDFIVRTMTGRVGLADKEIAASM